MSKTTAPPEPKNPAAVALGSIRNEKKAAAARVNGKRGGYPKGKPRKAAGSPENILAALSEAKPALHKEEA